MRTHRGTAYVEIRIPAGHGSQAEAGMASAFGWLSPRPPRSRCVAAFPADLPGGDHQMTLAVELTLAARWSSARRQAEISEALSQLDQAGISYTHIQVEVGELVYLPKNTPGR